MRAAATCLAAMLLGACTAEVVVGAEERWAVPPDTTVDEPLEVTSTAPDLPRDPYDDMATPALPPELLLLAGDVIGWNISGPRSTSPMRYPPTRDCALVDVVRSIDRQPNLETVGNSASTTFYNMLVELNSIAEATAVLDAADQAWIDCPTFTDSGPGRLERLDVPSGGWRSAGLMIGTTQNDVYIGYWQLGSNIVKLRVVGPDARQDFPQLAEAVARKLATGDPFNTQPVEDEPVSTDAIDPEYDAVDVTEAWKEHPLAPLILDAAELGTSWERYYVSEVEPESGELLACDLDEPALLDGIGANFLSSEPEVSFTQLVGEGDLSEVQLWVDTLRALGSCVDAASGFEFTALTLDPGTARADDLAGLEVSSGPAEEFPYSATWIAARYGTILVATSWSVEGEGFASTIPPIDEMIRVLELAAPD